MNNAFVFYVEPHDSSVPFFPCHVYFKHGGGANSVVKKLLNDIVKKLDASPNIHIMLITTDGDPSYQELCDLIYNEMHSISTKFNLDELINHDYENKLYYYKPIISSIKIYFFNGCTR